MIQPLCSALVQYKHVVVYHMEYDCYRTRIDAMLVEIGHHQITPPVVLVFIKDVLFSIVETPSICETYIKDMLHSIYSTFTISKSFITGEYTVTHKIHDDTMPL